MIAAMEHQPRPAGPIVVAVLALAQGAVGVLRAAQWIEVGSDLSRHGVLLLPIVGAMAFGRAVLIGALAVLYGLFALGLLARRGWAWALGLVAAAANLGLVALALVGAESAWRALVWAIVPVLVAAYLLGPARRQTA
jgi:hypothetical protein